MHVCRAVPWPGSVQSVAKRYASCKIGPVPTRVLFWSVSDDDEETPITGSPALGPPPRPDARPGGVRTGPRSLTPRDVPRMPAPGSLPAQVPTLRTVSSQLVGMAGQLHGARHDVDTVILSTQSLEKLSGQILARLDRMERARLMAADTQVLRLPTMPLPGQLTGPGMGGMGGPSTPAPPSSTEPRPSLAVRASQAAAKGSAVWGRRVTMLIGVITVVAQLAAPAIPKYSGPIVQIIHILKGDPPAP